MKTNEDLQRDVENAIKWEPLLHEAEIVVATKDGVVTLTGIVDSYTKKVEAEYATKNVAGVKAVVEKIKIELGQNGRKTDNEIAEEVLSAFKWKWDLPKDKVTAQIEDGWVTLDGELEWHFQKLAAKQAVVNLLGVKGVSNNITIKSETDDKIEKKAIEFALERNWSLNSQNIHVEVMGSKVKLSGNVHSFYQWSEAEKIAWNAVGVSNVSNDLIVDYN